MTDIMKQNLTKKYGQDYVNALIFTSSAEGLFANVVGDKGGITFKGIARTYNARWDGWRIIDKALEQYPELKTPYYKAPESVKKLNAILNGSEELDYLVYDFYFENYFKKVGADRIGGKLAVILFDTSVLFGVKRSSKTLQKILTRVFKENIVVDGIIGSVTINKTKELIQAKGEDIFVANMLLEYTDNVNEASKLGGNAKFLQGWLNRITNLSNYLRKL
jgi:lysozyme family protein